jgi:DGQHR domain-containing protein
MAHFDIPCILFKQRESAGSPQYAIFEMAAHEVLQWAAIRRREDEPDGPQRRLSKAKINAIRRFFELDDRNTIPPAVTVTLSLPANAVQPVDPGRPDIASLKVLSFDVPNDATSQQKPGLVIDGQHRLLGMDAFDHECRVSIVALLDVDDMEKAFQFLVINNKSTRVPTDHIRTLALDYHGQEDALVDRLRTARLNLDDNLRYVRIMDWDDASPFQGHIALVTHEGDEANRFIAPAAIENAVAVVQKKNVRELGNDDALCEFVYGIWQPICDRWPQLWAADSKLMHKVSIVAMTSYACELLVSRYDWGELDIADPEAVRSTVGTLLDSQTPDFWEKDWSIRINDSQLVRDTIIDSLTRIARNIRAEQPWHEGVDIVSL